MLGVTTAYRTGIKARSSGKNLATEFPSHVSIYMVMLAGNVNN
jgi:hypothetical protein